MTINQLNITNLTGLWNKYGANPIESIHGVTLHGNRSWPNRYWFEITDSEQVDNLTPDQLQKTLDKLINLVPSSKMLPILPLVNGSEKINKAINEWLQQYLDNNNWQLTLEQTAMYLDLESYLCNSAANNNQLNVQKISSVEDIKAWVTVCEEAFGYSIDQSVIEHVKNHSEIQLLLAHINNQPVATALTYITQGIVGIHQVGVRKNQQGKGIAKQLMEKIIEQNKLDNKKLVVLQASKVGKPLYDRLGFGVLFEIGSFKR